MSDNQELGELIKAAQLGVASALEAIVACFGGAIRQECHRYASKLPPDLSQADLEQEVMLRVLTKIYQFQSLDSEQETEAAFAGWIRASARSTLNNLHRYRNAQRRAPENRPTAFDEGDMPSQVYFPTASGPSSVVAREEEASRLRETMNQRLDEQTIEILHRRIVDGQSFQQICEAMSLSYDQVRYAFHTAQARLKNWLS